MTFLRVCYLLLQWLPPNDPLFDPSVSYEMIDRKERRSVAPLFTYFHINNNSQYPLLKYRGDRDKSIELI